MLAHIYPVGRGEGPDNSLPGLEGGGERPTNPIVLPPLPGVWPKPGTPSNPIVIPPQISNPIVIPGSPENPITLPPGSVWPPLPPSTPDKHAILIWVIGVGTRWLIVDAGQIDNSLPGYAQPK